MLQRAASNAYSWWWASHIRTTQSKWLDTNLQDMEAMIKRILFLLGEEADTFAKRAEMYYKRRPEVIGAVEEAYRAYRALAERYDHMSGELHRANHTVAAAFPDQVQYAMLDQDKHGDDGVDGGLPRAFTTVDPRKVRKATVDELMKNNKKKKNKNDRGKNHAAPVNAQAEISRLQKEILVLQTEKEFIKSCYESGIAKFWDLEKQINDMQEDLCSFQEEFAEDSAVIEDDEARALMTASALKSCEHAIAKLHRRQRLCFGQAICELEKANVSKQKLKNIMENHGMSLPDSGDPHHENAPWKDVSVQIQIDDVYSVEREKQIGMEAMVDKIKGYFQRDGGVSVADIAEKIDELVDKVADLELMASSQDAKIERMCLENMELEKSLHELEEEEEEEENTAAPCRSGELDEKIDKAKDELMRVQHLEISFHAQESAVCSNFSGTATSFYDIMDMLQLQSSFMIEHRADHAADKCEGTEPEVHPVMDEAEREPETDGDCLSNDHNSQSSGDCPDPDQIQPEKHRHVDDDSENLLHYGIEETSICADASVDNKTRENADDNNTFGEHEPEVDLVMDEAAREPERDGDCLSKMELAVSSDHNSQSSGDCPDPDQIQTEKHHHVDDDSENLLHYGIEETAISADASVDDKTRENADDDNTFGEHENSEGEQDVGQIVGDSVQPYIAQSDERDSSERETTNGSDEDSENSVPGNGEVAGVGDQEENMAHLQQLLMSGLQDKEKLLLTEYTSILRNYKNTKRALQEAEMKNQEQISGMAAMASELRRANAAKDDEIRSLHQLLNSSTDINASNTSNQIDAETSSSFRSGNSRGGHRRSSASSFSRERSVSSISRLLMKTSSNLESANEGDESLHDVVMDPESIHLEELELTNVAETENLSPVEDKFRRDIDGILEENLDFWLKFSTSLQKIQEFQSRHEEIQAEICKSETEATEKQVRLRELKIDLQVWLEQTAMLKGELQCRFISLTAIHDEIQEEEGDRLAPYQAAKFTGEIINMKQENSKVSDELQAGVDHVRDVHAEIVEKLTPKMVGGGGAASSTRRDAALRRVPLRSFLFPAKRKKTTKTPSLLSCVNPALQKQHSDMDFLR